MLKHACIAIALLALGFIGASPSLAEKAPADILPKSVAAYIEISQPKQLIDLLLNHPLRKHIEESEAFRKAIRDNNYQQFLAVVSLIEAKSKTTWQDALKAAIGDGAALAFDVKSGGVILIARPADEKTADHVRDAIFELARTDAANKGNPDPIKQVDYRGQTAYHTGELIIANLGPFIIATNKEQLAKDVADHFIDGGAGLMEDADFTDAHRRAAAGKSHITGWAFVRGELLRQSSPPWLDPANKSDNVATELLIGGLIPTLRKTAALAMSFRVDESSIAATIASHTEPDWQTPERKFYFAAPGDGAAAPLQLPDTLATFAIYRDLAAMWQSAPDLFNEAVATRMAQADSQFSLFFGGKAFSGEILTSIKPQIRLVVAKQDYDPSAKVPALKLPAAALVFECKPEQFAKVSRSFRAAHQTLMAFVNIDGTQKGRPMMETKNEARGDSEITYSAYITADEDTSKKAPGAGAAKEDTFLNFAPALLIDKKHMAICTSRQIAQQLADALAQSGVDKPTADNALIHLSAPQISQLIAANHDQLVAKNMLEKGHDRSTAEREIGFFKAFVDALKSADVRLKTAEHDVRLELELQLSGK